MVRAVSLGLTSDEPGFSRSQTALQLFSNTKKYMIKGEKTSEPLAILVSGHTVLFLRPSVYMILLRVNYENRVMYTLPG